MTGTATILQNYEPAVEGGYRRIDGFAKWDSTVVPGQGAILGVKVSAGLGEVFAARKSVAGTEVDLYRGSGSGWTKLNSVGQNSTATKYRIISYSITTPVVVFCDGKGYALKWNGSTDTLLNGTGAPTNPKYAAQHLARLWLSGYGTGSLITGSAPNDDTNYSGAADAVEFNVGDVVVGLKKFRDTLYIFCKNSIYKLAGTTIDDLMVVPVTTQIGCVSGDTIAEVGGDLVFLSGEGIRSLAATERIGDLELGILSKAIQPELRVITNAAEYGEDSYCSCVVAAKSQYRLFLYDSDLGDNDALGWLGKRVSEEGTGAVGFEWANIAGFNTYCADSEYVSNREIVLHGHPTNGYVYRQERGNSRDGSNIVANYRTPDLIFTNAELRKVMHWIRLYTQVEGDLDLDCQVLFDFEDEDKEQPAVIEIVQSGEVSQYGTAVYDTSVYSSTSFPVFRKNLTGSGLVAAFQFSSSGTAASHRIDSIQVVFAAKGRR